MNGEQEIVVWNSTCTFSFILNGIQFIQVTFLDSWIDNEKPTQMFATNNSASGLNVILHSNGFTWLVVPVVKAISGTTSFPFASTALDMLKQDNIEVIVRKSEQRAK